MKIYIVNEKQYCCDGMYHDDIDDNALIKIIRLLLGFASDLSSSTKMSTNSEKAMLSLFLRLLDCPQSQFDSYLRNLTAKLDWLANQKL